MTELEYDKDQEVWDFFLLKLHVDPQYSDDIKDLEIDQVTWRMFLLKALKELHGTFGSSLDTDIVQRYDKEAIVRVQKEDVLMFKSAMVAFITDLESLGKSGIKANLQIKRVANDYMLEGLRP